MAVRGLLMPFPNTSPSHPAVVMIPAVISWFGKVSGPRRARFYCRHHTAEIDMPVSMSEYRRDKFAQRMGAAGLKHHHRIAIAVSGGPDSMALCVLTADWKSDNLVDSATAVTTKGRGNPVDGLLAIVVDHGLRPESAEEADLVRNRVSDMGIKCEVARCDWLDGRPGPGHLQEAARNKRYETLQTICMHQQISILLVAHHADDQAELFILRLSRNSGVLGLAGMSFASQMFSQFPDFCGQESKPRGILIVRPLLDFSKEDMYDICRSGNQQWVEDPTNRSPVYARNRIRMSLSNLSSSIFKIELQATISACRRTRLLVDKFCNLLLKQAVTIMHHGYAVIDLETLRSMEVKDIYLAKFVTSVVQFISQRHRPVRGKAVKLLQSYIRTFPSKTSLTVGGCYLCPAPGSKGTKVLVCCSINLSFPVTMKLFHPFSCFPTSDLEQIVKESEAYLDRFTPDAYSSAPFSDMASSSESVLIEAKQLGILSHSTYESIVSLQQEESDNFKSKAEAVSKFASKDEIQSSNDAATDLNNFIMPGQVGYFMDRFVVDWKMYDGEGDCFCSSGDERGAEVRHMVDADWLYLSELSKKKNKANVGPPEENNHETIKDDKCSSSHYSILSASRAIECIKSIPVAARRSMPVLVNAQGLVLSIPKIIAICQSGGEFVANKDDGSLFYTGGEAYALDLDHQTQLKDFKHELAETFQFSARALSIKYFLPGNRKTLITISKDKDLKRMVNFFKDTDQVEVFIIAEEEEAAAPNVSNMPASRSSRTTVSGAAVPSDVPVDVMQTDDAIVLDEPIETTPLGACSFSNEDRHRRAATQWENIITGVDQRFNTFAEFREALHKYSIAHGFTYKYKKNDSHRVTAKCKTEGCPWRIYASRLATTQLICIKKMNPEHTCEGATVKAGYRATRGWIGNIIKEKLKVSPNYKPKDIASDIKREYGIQLNYTQAWRAKEIAREQLQGSYKEAYSQLPFFCQNIMETNPGSLATFSTKEDSSFRRFFVSFHASISGFHQCRPLLFLDSTLLYSKYQGTLLAATAADGNDDFFPVAFAVVDEETEDNWKWFLSELKSALSTSEHITFVSDFQKGIKQSLIDIFGNECNHGYCLRSLAEKLNKDLKGQFSHDARRLMVQDFYAAAYAPKVEVFERCAENIKAISIEAYDWVIRSQPEHWANAIFGGARYNHMTSNFGQQFYSWVSEVDELPITQMVDVLRGKIMELIYRRRLESSQWVTRLTPFMEDKLQLEMSKARSFQVALVHGSTFEVRGGESVDIVDIDHWDCSCKGWQLMGLPCCHAIAVINCLGRSLYDFCSRFFTTESYRLTYTESINPIPNVEKPERSELHEATIVTPPPTKRPPGRPKLKSAESVDVIKRQLQCSKCKGLGHNKKTCYKVNGVGVEEPETPTLTVLGTDEPEGSS